MKISKMCVVPLCLVAALCVATTCYGQAPQVLFVGSSGAFNSMAVSAVSPDKQQTPNVPAPCNPSQLAANFWTVKSSTSKPTAHGVDPRSGAPPEPGTLWATWDNSASPTIVCAYLSVDSVVGQRLFFGTAGSPAHAATLSIDPSLPANDPVNCPAGAGTLGVKAVPFIDDSANTLPCPVFMLLNGAVFNAGASDIRPEDALYANTRALLPCNGSCATDHNKSGLGYGPYPTGNAIQSAFSATSAQVIAYNTSGSDPISGAAVEPAYVLQIGAYPMMIFANITKTTNPGDFGMTVPTDILSHVVANVWSGLSTRTSDVTGSLTAAGQPLAVLEREMTSGTGNTFEWQLVRNKGIVETQENLVDPTDNLSSDPGNCTQPMVLTKNCGNPFNHVDAHSGATRSRVIGTGEMVSTAGGKSSGTPPSCSATGLANALGYAFWSFSTYADLCTQANLRYLQLDGNDPLFPSYSANPAGAGHFPTCSGTIATGITCTAIPFTHMVNGDYRNWNIIRVTIRQNYTSPGTGPSVMALILAAQDQAASTIPDFVPFVFCPSGGTCSPAAIDSSKAEGFDPPTGVKTGLLAFRSHYTFPSIPVGGGVVVNPSTGSAINGTNQTTIGPFAPYSENGGDMAGAIFTVQSDIDFLADTGFELAGPNGDQQ
jgi:hypothetical protein